MGALPPNPPRFTGYRHRPLGSVPPSTGRSEDRLRCAHCGCDVGLEPFADVPARPLMRPSLRSMRFESTVSPSLVETRAFLPSFPRIRSSWCLLRQKPASRHKNGLPGVCSGQGLFLGGRPCPVFSISGHSCGQGPSPRIRPCPINPFRRLRFTNPLTYPNLLHQIMREWVERQFMYFTVE